MPNQIQENSANKRDAETLRNEQRKEENMSTEDKAIRNIVRTWNGGEHVLAGARASELVYGKGKTPKDKLIERLKTEGALGIERYIAPPSVGMTETVDDQSGNPLATQPENRPEAIGASNQSSEAGKDEQDAIDKALEAGRNQRENPNETAVNPAGSEVEAGLKNKADPTKKK